MKVRIKSTPFFYVLFALLGSTYVFGQDYFQQDVHYTIKVKLNDKNHSLSAYEELKYVNNSPDTLTFIYFHIWPNAYKNHETALAKQIFESGDNGFYHSKPNDRGFIDSLNFSVDGVGIKWELDEQHIDICKLHLNEPLLPGKEILISTPFYVKIPKGVFSRLGHMGESYQITQWYPKPAVYDRKGWHQMPYLNQGEFYSEFGSFDVSITLPKNYVLGATGDMVEGESELLWLQEKEKATREIKVFNKKDDSFPASSKELKTLRFKQDKVHDFAWFADKRYHVLSGDVKLPHSGRNVKTWVMFTNNEAHLWKKSIEYVNDAIYYYSLWNGDYPYNHMTAVDGALSAGGGMEYPNITVIGRSVNDRTLETVIMHEVGHNWFYGILGSNERDYPWMDEGMNSFNEMRYVTTKYPKSTIGDMAKPLDKIMDPDYFKSRQMYYIAYLMAARSKSDQPVQMHSAEYSSSNYGMIVYMKTAATFWYLKDYLGESIFDQCMQTYFEKWKFKHPYPLDVQEVFEEVSSKDLNWFFSDIFQSTGKIDYKVTKAKNVTMKGDSQRVFQVDVRNKGDLKVPFSIGVLSGDSLLDHVWVDELVDGSMFIFPVPKKARVQLDPFWSMPEVNRKNNTIYPGRLLPKVEPINFTSLGGIENPRFSELYQMPISAWNAYDKWMIGWLGYNTLVPGKCLEYELAPMYSLGTSDLSGLGAVRVNYLPDDLPVTKITAGINGRRFHYANSTDGDDYIKNKYNRIAGNLTLKFRSSPRSFIRNKLVYEPILIMEEYDFSILGLKSKYGKNFHYHRLSHNFTYDNPVLREVAKAEVETGFSYLKTSLETKSTWFYNDQNNYLQLRLFGGKYWFNNLTYAYQTAYKFYMGGKNGVGDYTYDNLVFGRYETDGVFSRQMNENDGAFKVLNPSGSSGDWLLSANLKGSFPLINTNLLGWYADFGWVPVGYNIDGVQSTGVELLSNAGIFVAAGPVNVYFPIILSESIKSANDGKKPVDLIRFSLDLKTLNPVEKIQNFDL